MYSIILSILLSQAYGETPEEIIARQATEYGAMQLVSSKSRDSIGVEGLWGIEGHFIVAASCMDTFNALRDIPSYPHYTSSVKRVEVIEETENSLTVDYTEGGFGFESTSQLQWTFHPTASPPSITSISVGSTDAPSWVQFKFIQVPVKDYCQLNLKMFADMSLVPDFLMGWVSAKAAEELVSTYRSIVIGHKRSQP